MLTYTELTAESVYVDKTWSLMLQLEDAKYGVYADSRGYASIGVGFNLTVPEVQDAVYRELGFANPVVLRESGDEATAALEEYYMSQLTTLLTSGSTQLQTELDAIMLARANDTRYTVIDITRRTTFTFSPADTGLTEMRNVFDSIRGYYETEINNRFTGVPWSKERVALFSLAYNNPALLGSGLQGAINTGSGNRAEAWFEIRYRSNGGSSDGIAKRRYYEAEVFGLYDEGTTAVTISDAEARQVYQMYTDHQAQILDYQRVYGHMVAQASSDYLAPVQTLSESLQPTTDYLNLEYVTDTGHADINPLSIQVGGDSADVLHGAELDDPFTDGHDLLLGGEDNDRLYGNGGNDVLYG